MSKLLSSTSPSRRPLPRWKWLDRLTRDIADTVRRELFSIVDRRLLALEEVVEAQREALAELSQQAESLAARVELAHPQKMFGKPAFDDDPTFLPPPWYPTLDAAIQVYGSAFQASMAYVHSQRMTGPILEFGVFKGFTARWLARLIGHLEYPGDLWLYDSFTGFATPRNDVDAACYEVAESGKWRQGECALVPGESAKVRRALTTLLDRGRVHIVEGFFEDSIPDRLPNAPCALVHIDCDRFDATSHVLRSLSQRNLLQDGAVLLFDDYNCNRAQPSMGERRALSEFLATHDRWSVSPYFTYGCHGQAFFLHDSQVGLSTQSPHPSLIAID